MGGVEIGFTGHRHDGDLSLIDMRGRVYDPVQKHFLSPDPILGAPLSGRDLNWYSYAWNNPLSIVDPTGLQESPGGFRPPTPLPTSTDAILSFFKSLFSPSPAPSAAGPSPEKKGLTPSPPTSDGQGAKPSTGSGAAPTPQELPPGPTPRPRLAGEVDENGFVPYNAGVQRSGGFVAGVSIGLVPFGSLVANALIAAGVLVEGTPEAREGLANGQLLGGLIGMVWGAGKAPSAAPVQAPRPMPATAGGGSAPPLVVVPNATGVLLGVGGVVTIAAAGAEMAVALSTGGGDDAGSAPAATPAPSAPRNAHLAGNKHPVTGVLFDSQGFPDFRATGLVKVEVKIAPTGSRLADFRAANKAAGFTATPDGFTWHHHQDGVTMQLVPKDIHSATGHTGGFSLR